MWGAKIYQNRQVILIASSKLFYETEHTMQYGYDQAMLNACIWPLAINDSVCTCTAVLYILMYQHHNCIYYLIMMFK